MENKALKKPVFITTQTLEPGTRVNMHLKVVSKKITEDGLRYDGSRIRHAEVLVGDQYGCAILNAKNE
jgi:replication factor A1